MNNSNSFINLVRSFGKVVGNADKAPAKEQIAIGKALIDAGYHNVLADVNNAFVFCKKNNMDVAEFTFEVANVSQAVIDTLAGKPTGYLAKLDTKQSGLLLQSMILRDEIALETLLSDIDIYTWFIKKLNIDISRKKIKKIVIPRYYGSEIGIIIKFEQLGHKEKAFEFFKLYAELLPKCDQLRQIMLDAWNWGKDSYHWITPDLGECNQAVQELAEEGTWSKVVSKFNWGTRDHGMCYANAYIPHKGCRPFGKDGTRSLGANLIHSLDAYVLRELVRRCSQADRYTEIWFKLGKATQNGILFSKDPKVQKFYDFWKKTGIPSLRVLEYISAGDNLPVEYYNAIGKGVRRLPECRFDIYFTVHDEFACKVNYADLMQKQFNYIISDIYQGHYLDYVKEAFEWDTARFLKPGMGDIDLSPINPNTVERIENSEVILQ